MQSAWMGIDSSVVLDSLKSLLRIGSRPNGPFWRRPRSNARHSWKKRCAR